MKIPKLVIHNFLSIADTGLTLSDCGLVGVFGTNLDAPGASSNGSGKSTIWDALGWCLYGKTFRGLEGDEIVKLRSKGGCIVSVSLVIDGQDWTVKRYRKHSASKNELHLFCEGNDVTAATVAETQDRIIKLLGMDWETFAVCVAFGQDTLRFAKATDKEQKAILDRILGTERYEKAYEVVRKMKAGMEADIRHCEENIQTAKTLILSHEQLIKDIEEGRAKKLRELEQFKKTCREKIKTLGEALLDSPTKQEYLKKKQDDLRAQRDSLQAKLGKDHSALIRSLKGEITMKYAEIDHAKAQAEETAEDMEAIKSAARKCRECKQAINEQEYNKQLTGAELAATAAKERHTKLVEESEKFVVDREKEVKRLEAEQLGFANNAKELARIKAEATRAEAALDTHKDTDRNLVSQIAEQKTRLANADEKVEDSSKPIKSCEEKIKENQAAIATHNAEKTELDSLLKSLDFWVKGFGPGGIRSFIIDSMVPYLTERAQYYADALLDGSIQIAFNTQKALKSGELREKFEVQVVNAYGAEIYKGNSAGERQRIDLCVALALYDLARTRAKAPVELVIFDEAFERLDTAGCDRVIRLLKKESKNWKSCFVTTHSSDLAGYFDSKLTITKEGGDSRIVTNLKGVPQDGQKNRKDMEKQNIRVE